VWSVLFELAVVLLAAWFVWRIIAQRFPRPSQPAEPGDYAGTPARLRPRPGSRSGAVALAEPDEDDEEQPFSPPSTRRTGSH
jgi:hypothetical protein